MKRLVLAGVCLFLVLLAGCNTPVSGVNPPVRESPAAPSTLNITPGIPSATPSTQESSVSIPGESPSVILLPTSTFISPAPYRQPKPFGSPILSPPTPIKALPSPDAFMKGMAFNDWGWGFDKPRPPMFGPLYHPPQADVSLKRLATTGVN
jgi:hypothetical protein